MIEVTSIKIEGHNCFNKILRKAGKINNINKSKVLPIIKISKKHVI